MVHIRTAAFRNAALALILIPLPLCAFAQGDAPPPPADGSTAEPKGSGPSRSGTSNSNDVIDPATGLPSPTRPIEESLEGRTQDYVVGAPEGKTLPARVLRVKIQTRTSEGNFGFDKSGNRVSAAKASGFGMGPIIEYGITDELSVQIGIPFTLSNEVGIDAAKFRETDVYKSNYEKFLNTAAGLLQSKGLCPSAGACRKLIDGGYALPYGTEVTLPTGEKLRVNPGQRVTDVADALVLNGARQQSGKTGLGDIEIGALYEVLNQRGPITGTPIFVSLGGGFRLPTGSFKEVPAGQRATSRGTLDFGFRSNVDFTPARGVFLSWQNQLETMVAKGKKRRSSQLDSGALNSADPTSPAAVASGSNGKGNELDFERKGVRNLGFLKLGVGLGLFTQALKPIGVNTKFNYDYDSKEYLGGQQQGDPRRQFGWQSGVSWDGLAYKVPLQLDVDYEIPVAGRNVGVATRNLIATLKGYYKF